MWKRLWFPCTLGESVLKGLQQTQMSIKRVESELIAGSLEGNRQPAYNMFSRRCFAPFSCRKYQSRFSLCLSLTSDRRAAGGGLKTVTLTLIESLFIISAPMRWIRNETVVLRMVQLFTLWTQQRVRRLEHSLMFHGFSVCRWHLALRVPETPLCDPSLTDQRSVVVWYLRGWRLWKTWLQCEIHTRIKETRGDSVLMSTLQHKYEV